MVEIVAVGVWKGIPLRCRFALLPGHDDRDGLGAVFRHCFLNPWLGTFVLWLLFLFSSSSRDMTSSASRHSITAVSGSGPILDSGSRAKAWPVGLRPPGPVDVPTDRQILDVHDVRARWDLVGYAFQIALNVGGHHVGAEVVLAGRLQAVADTVHLGHSRTSLAGDVQRDWGR
jgi:hypothetical protein